jgi:hypothetical protein
MTELQESGGSDDLSVDALVRRHYEAFWSPGLVEEVPRAGDRAWRRLPDLRIVRIRPVPEPGLWVYATVGAWAGTEDSNHNLEFLAVGRSEAPNLAERLSLVAEYQAGPPSNRLDVGHTIPIGEGWEERSSLDHVLVSLPYLWGPGLEHLVLPDRHIRILWLLPIHGIEAEYRHRFGLEALERRFEQAHFDVLDPSRRPVVTADDLERDAPS